MLKNTFKRTAIKHFIKKSTFQVETSFVTNVSEGCVWDRKDYITYILRGGSFIKILVKFDLHNMTYFTESVSVKGMRKQTSVQEGGPYRSMDHLFKDVKEVLSPC